MNYYGLADCNNFYASCERAFNPKLRNRPIAVLSNNDGCIVARSKELKALNIPMAIPYWKCKDILAEHNTAILSSNYRLYGDMSDRVMDMLDHAYAETEIYSIDEAFIRAFGYDDALLLKHSLKTRTDILRATGIPISIGFGKTKTLAKLANKLAKGKTYQGPGVAILHPDHPSLDVLPVDKVWGINKGLKARLATINIYTIRDFMIANTAAVRKRLGIIGVRMQYELNGMPCTDLAPHRTQRKNIMVSRTFGKDVSSLDDLMESVSKHAARAGEKLRRFNQVATGIGVFIRTNPFKEHLPQIKRSGAASLPIASSDTSVLIIAAKEILRSIHKRGNAYKKLGVYLFDLRPNQPIQTHLFHNSQNIPQRNSLMEAMDSINQKMGKGTLRMASYQEDIHRLYRKELQSDEFTTDWNGILQVR